MKLDIEKRMLNLDVERKIIRILDSEKDNHVLLDYTKEETRFRPKKIEKSKIKKQQFVAKGGSSRRYQNRMEV